MCVTTNGTLLPGGEPFWQGVHKVSVSLHSFEGNDCPGSMEEYLSGVWDFCSRASAEGTLCALRLWNIGGRDSCNGQVLAFLGNSWAGTCCLSPRTAGEPEAFRECFPGAGGKI